MKYKISCSPDGGAGKKATFNYQVLETDNIKKFVKAINLFATAPAEFKGGHRANENITEIFNWLRFDTDKKGEADELEKKLKQLFYIKKPSTRNALFPYKWHFLVAVENTAQNHAQFKDQCLQF